MLTGYCLHFFYYVLSLAGELLVWSIILSCNTYFGLEGKLKLTRFYKMNKILSTHVTTHLVVTPTIPYCTTFIIVNLQTLPKTKWQPSFNQIWQLWHDTTTRHRQQQNFVLYVSPIPIHSAFKRFSDFAAVTSFGTGNVWVVAAQFQIICLCSSWYFDK